MHVVYLAGCRSAKQPKGITAVYAYGIIMEDRNIYWSRGRSCHRVGNCCVILVVILRPSV